MLLRFHYYPFLSLLVLPIILIVATASASSRHYYRLLHFCLQVLPLPLAIPIAGFTRRAATAAGLASPYGTASTVTTTASKCHRYRFLSLSQVLRRRTATAASLLSVALLAVS